MKSLALWQSLNMGENWEIWLNKTAQDGTLLDTDDSVSFINKQKKRAIKIIYEPNEGRI